MKRYLITGASRGIGRAIAQKLAGSGHHLLLHGRDSDALQETCRLVQGKSEKVTPLQFDLREKTMVTRMIEQIGPEPIAGLVNNAGIAVVKPLADISLEDWESTLAVNVTAPFLLTQAFAPKMVAGSSVVNILSVAAKSGFPGWSSYCMSKFALEGFSQSVREELRSRNIRVLNIYPAATSTEIWRSVQGDWPRDRMLPAEEVANAVHYALSRPADVGLENISLQNVSGRL